jgi:hypothetical protein
MVFELPAEPTLAVPSRYFDEEQEYVFLSCPCARSGRARRARSPIVVIIERLTIGLNLLPSMGNSCLKV